MNSHLALRLGYLVRRSNAPVPGFQKTDTLTTASVVVRWKSERAVHYDDPAARQGERSGDVLRAGMARRIGSEPLASLDYVALVDDAAWEDVDLLEGPARALVAASFGSARLIDNVLLPWSGSEAVQNTRREGA